MTIFLDRDGVINQRIVGSYVMHPEQFHFLPGTLEAIRYLSQKFARVVVVTNQQGIGKGLFSEEQLKRVHDFMKENIQKAGGKIDKIYFCPKLAKENPVCRKPNIGMAIQAQLDFPDIVFEESVMVGDSISDMVFGQQLNMKTVYIETKVEEQEKGKNLKVDYRSKSLSEFAELLKHGKFSFE